MAQVNHRPSNLVPGEARGAVPYAAAGHPSIEELISGQGAGPIGDVSSLQGDFWPPEESIEEFVATVREWRGHGSGDPLA